MLIKALNNISWCGLFATRFIHYHFFIKKENSEKIFSPNASSQSNVRIAKRKTKRHRIFVNVLEIKDENLSVFTAYCAVIYCNFLQFLLLIVLFINLKNYHYSLFLKKYIIFSFTSVVKHNYKTPSTLIKSSITCYPHTIHYPVGIALNSDLSRNI